MFHTPLAARRQSQRAFTLLEVMVAVVVVGVLLAAGVFQARSWVVAQRAEAEAEAALANVLAAQKDLAATHGVYTTRAADLRFIGALAAVSGQPSTGPREVSAAVGVHGTLGLAALTDDGRCVMWQVEPLGAGGAQQRIPEDEAQGPCAGALALPEGQAAAVQTGNVRAHD